MAVFLVFKLNFFNSLFFKHFPVVINYKYPKDNQSCSNNEFG